MSFMQRGLMIAVFLLMGAVCAQGEIVVAHFGDSTCACAYLKPEERVDAILEKTLRKYYRGQEIDNVNVAKGGEFIRLLLDGGRSIYNNKIHPKRYEESIRKQCPRIDIALVRYGQNDWNLRNRKDVAPDGYNEETFRKDLVRLIETLQKDYPGIHVILETGTYYGDESDRMANRYWDVVRAVARERGLPLVDNYKRWEEEVKHGTPVDKLHREKDKEHPSALGVSIHADEEFKVIRALWPKRLPRAEKGTDLFFRNSPQPDTRKW